jgi:hypothetical protein
VLLKFRHGPEELVAVETFIYHLIAFGSGGHHFTPAGSSV